MPAERERGRSGSVSQIELGCRELTGVYSPRLIEGETAMKSKLNTALAAGACALAVSFGAAKADTLARYVLGVLLH